MHIPQSMLWGSYPRHLRISTSIVITPLSIVWFTYMQTCIHVKVFASEYLHIHFSMDVTYVNFLLIAQTFKTFHYSSFFLHTLVVSPFFTKGHLFLEHFPCHNINDCWTFPFFFFATRIEVSLFLNTWKTSPQITPPLDLALGSHKYIRPEYNY